jgi:hypothetical protein
MGRFLGWLLIFVGITFLCFIPTEIFLLIYFLVSPNGFWQKFAVYGVGIWLLGGLQVFGLIVYLAFWGKMLE